MNIGPKDGSCSDDFGGIEDDEKSEMTSRSQQLADLLSMFKVHESKQGILLSDHRRVAIPSITLDMFPNVVEGGVCIEGKVGYAFAGALAPVDIEYIQSDDGRVFADYYMFRGIPFGTRVRVIKRDGMLICEKAL